MKSNKNIVKDFVRYFILTIVILSIVSTILISHIQKDKLYRDISKNIAKQVDMGLEKNNLNISSQLFFNHLKMIGFDLFELYAKNKNELFSFTKEDQNPQIVDKLETYMETSKQHLLRNKEPYYKFIELKNENYYILIFYNIYKDNKFLGYIEGEVKVDKNILVKTQQNIFYTIVIIIVTIIIFSLFIFPLIYYAYRQLEKDRIQLIQKNISIVSTLGNAIALRDSTTNEHNYRVTIYAIRLAKKLHLNDTQIKKLIIGAFLHDVGKIGISDCILLKNSKLTNDEYNMMKEHVKKGVELIAKDDWLKIGKDVIAAHHEKYDGSGYPNKLKGENIPLIARIFTIVDVFDALTSKRPYKEAFNYEKSIQILYDSRGSCFDPTILDKFISISNDLYENIKNSTNQQLKNELHIMVEEYFLN